jgi:hypothetical protein
MSQLVAVRGEYSTRMRTGYAGTCLEIYIYNSITTGNQYRTHEPITCNRDIEYIVGFMAKEPQ